MDKSKSPSKMNNRGFSLLELLIAITILSIVVVAFYRIFVVSAKVNAKAKIQHQATSLAQDIMEACKSVDMDELMMEFEYPVYSVKVLADDSSKLYTHFSLLPDVINANAFTDITNVKNYIGTFAPKSKDKAGNALTSYIDASSIKQKAVYNTLKTDILYYIKDGSYIPTKDGKYYLYLQDLVMDQRHYDALITLDGLPYMEDTENSNKIASGQAYNSTELVQLPNMDATVDVISSNSSIFDPEAESQLASIVGSSSFEVKNVSREIVIQIEENAMSGGDAGKTQQKVTVSYNYSYTDPSTGTKTTIRLHKDYPFNNTADLNTNLRNVFLFYNPRKDYKEDKIHLIRQVYPASGRTDLDVYIVKLLPSDYTSVGTSWDDQYKPVLEVEEGSGIIEETGVITGKYDAPSIVLHTNLGYYMTQDASGEFKKMSTCQVTSNGSLYGYKYNEEHKDHPETELRITTLTNKESVERIFNIQVDVFLHEGTSVLTYDNFKAKSDAHEAKASITSTIRN